MLRRISPQLVSPSRMAAHSCSGMLARSPSTTISWCRPCSMRSAISSRSPWWCNIRSSSVPPPGSMYRRSRPDRSRPREQPIAGSSGNGSIQHLALETFSRSTGAKILHIPFAGGGPLQEAQSRCGTSGRTAAARKFMVSSRSALIEEGSS